MRLREVILNVKSFVGNYCICEGNLVNILTGQEIENIKNQSEVLLFGKNNVITKDIRGNSNIVDFKNSTIDTNFKIDAVSYPYFTFYEFNNLDIEGIFDYTIQEKLFETKDWLGRDFIDEYIFGEVQGDVQCRVVKNGKIFWRFDLKSIPNNPHNDNYDKNADWEVKKFIGILEQKLWVALNHHTIIALDIETGQLLHQIHHIPSFKSEWLPSAIPLPEATFIDIKNNKLIGFMWEFYWEINPQSGEITLWDLTEYFLSESIRNDVKDFVLTENTIYFASHFDSKIGALDREKKQIIWQYEFTKDVDGREPRIMEIQGNDEMLGALSSDRTLFVFERENNP